MVLNQSSGIQERARGVRGFAVLLIAGAILSGCGKSDSESGQPAQEPPPAVETPSAPVPSANRPTVAPQNAAVQTPADPFDLTRFRAAFASARPGMQVYATETIDVIRARDFQFALEQLQKLARNPNLTPEQRSAVAETMQRVQSLASASAR